MQEILRFTTDKTDLNFSLEFTELSNVRIDFGDGYGCTVLSTTIANIYHYYADALIEHEIIVKSNNENYVKTINISDCGVSNFNTLKLTNLNKLVCYNNENLILENTPVLEDIKENYPNLQYLHIFNTGFINENDLTTIFNNLPDRNNNAFGSIIMYPFYPLGIFIEIEDDKYYKYPKTLILTDNNEEPHYEEIQLEENQYYKNMKSITTDWRQYKNGNLITLNEQNQLIDLRKSLENITLKNKWLFGSAIQYTPEEYQKCHHYFKQNHIQDYWETAEQGEGISIGIKDNFSLSLENLKNILNIKSYFKRDNTFNENELFLDIRTEGYNIVNYPLTSHGHAVIANLADRGISNYGISPNSDYILMNSFDITPITDSDIWKNNIEKLLKYSDIVSNSRIESSYTREDIVDLYRQFCIKHPFFEAGGNDGDSKDYEIDDYRTNFDDLYSEKCFIVNSLSVNDKPSTFTNTNSYHLSRQYSQYGENRIEIPPIKNQLMAIRGTSHATPVCSGVISLFKRVYDKLNKINSVQWPISKDNQNNKLYGNGSLFMEWFVKNHTNPLTESSNLAIGNGRPDLMYYNPIINLDLTNNNILVENLSLPNKEINLNFNEGYPIIPDILPENASNKNFTIQTHKTIKNIGIINNTLYLLKNIENDLEFDIYSNQDITVKDSIILKATNELSSFIPINKNIELFSDNTEYYKIKDNYNNSEKFTIQFNTTIPKDISSIMYIDTDYNEKNLKTILYLIKEKVTTNQYKVLLNFINRYKEFDSSIGYDSNSMILLDRYQLGQSDYEEEHQIDYYNTDFIFTLTFNKGYFKFYINSNLISYGQFDSKLKLNDLKFRFNGIKNKDINNILVYDRVLKEQEILQNTRYLLNN